jgi:hypothetical protein
VVDSWFLYIPYGRRRAALLALIVAQIVSLTFPGPRVSRADLLIDPEVRALVRTGRARVIVMLQVDDSGDDAQRADAIGRAQDAVLARLPQAHASVVRRFVSIPALALEIDHTALLALEQMTDVVAAVKLDRPVKPQ